MKNDFDFLKEKIENSGVKAPDDMDESFVLNAVSDVEPKPVALPNKRRGIRNAITAAAAALVLVAGLGIFFGVKKLQPGTIPGSAKLIQYKNRDEVQQAIDRLLKQQRKLAYDVIYYEENAAVADGSATTGSVSAGSESHSETYEQVEGVSEADIIKTDGKYIYCVSTKRDVIEIFTADGENAKKIASIDVDADAGAKHNSEKEYISDTLYISEFYLSGDRLIVVCNRYNADELQTYAMVYDISDIGNITLSDTLKQSGDYVSSRMIGDMLYTVSNYYVYESDEFPRCGTGSTYDEIDVDCIYSVCTPTDSEFLVITAYNTVDFDVQEECKAIFGGATDIYCSSENLYVYTNSTDYMTSTYADWGVFDTPQNVDPVSPVTRILRIGLNDGLSFSDLAEVDGRINNRYSLDEADGYLRVATTKNEDDKDVNCLYILDADMNVVGTTENFARNESIKAVRYVGNTAYVITYERTDPLFIIDLSDPSAPAIRGEVEISGFSTMLIPIDDNTLLGIGYHTQNEDYIDVEVQEGLKLALFDVSDPEHPAVLDSMSFVDCYSTVQYDPRALVRNNDRDDFVIPLNYSHYGTADLYTPEDKAYNPDDHSEFYGGMLNFRVEDGKIVVTDQYRSEKTDSVNRCVYVGDTVYMTYDDADSSVQLDSVQYR